MGEPLDILDVVGSIRGKALLRRYGLAGAGWSSGLVPGVGVGTARVSLRWWLWW
jgi:hypothetical protein